MKLLYRRCAGLDVHKKTVSACIRIRRGSKPVEIQEAMFGTFTADLVRLRDWLKQHKVKQVAMESTGVYWIPIWNVLEPVRFGFELLLVNPQLVRPCEAAKRIASTPNGLQNFYSMDCCMAASCRHGRCGNCGI
jgi:transposase